jgi:hypothetical protein
MRELDAVFPSEPTVGNAQPGRSRRREKPLSVSSVPTGGVAAAADERIHLGLRFPFSPRPAGGPVPLDFAQATILLGTPLSGKTSAMFGQRTCGTFDAKSHKEFNTTMIYADAWHKPDRGVQHI